MKGKEYKKISTKIKDVFYFKFEDTNISDRKTREVFKNQLKEIHYPFYEDKPKYNYIRSFSFLDVYPEDISGISAAAGKGLGFTYNLSPIIKELAKISQISQIIISKNGTTKIESNKAIFNISDLESIFKILKPLNDKHSKEKRKITNNLLAEIIPNRFKKDSSKYTKGDLMEFIISRDLKNTKISEEDVESIIEILPEEIKEQQVIYKIEDSVRFIKIKNAKEKFEKLISQKGDSISLEKRWHKFFKENDWIFSYVLLLPVAIYGDEVYVGGKTIKNKDGKVADFLYRNPLSENASIIEIKTHRTTICNKGAYRGTNVFSLNGKFTGAINQLLIQKDKLIKDYSVLLREEHESGKTDRFFNVFNPKCVLVIGSISNMTPKQRNNFDIFRNSMGNIEIITFDEIGKKLDYFINLLK